MKKSTYSANDIDVLEGLEPVRKKSGMYIGANDSRGIFQITKEIIDNVFDEYLAEYNTKLFVEVKGDVVTVADESRGIPVEIHPKTKESTLTTIFTKLHAGGKLGVKKDGSTAYKTSVGTFGVGSSVTNALSESFEVWTFRKAWYYQAFAKGKVKTKVKKGVKPPSVSGCTMKAGTVVRFKPDFTCFQKKSKLNTKNLLDWLKISSYLYPDLVFYLDLDGKKAKLHEPKGIKALVNKLVEDAKVEKLGKTVHIRSNNFEAVLQWSSHDEEKLLSYANGSKTEDGGTHVNGLFKALNESLKSFKGARSNYKPEDLRCGLLGVLDFKMPSPQFDSQTKSKLISKEAQDQVYETALEELKKFWRENPSTAKEIVRRANEVRSVVQSFTMSKKAAAALKVNKGGKVLLPAKLVVSNTKDPKERELYLVEGDSAGGSAEKARDAKTQEVLKLRGKILNVHKDKSQKAFTNNEIIDILKSIGYDPSKKKMDLRVGKIILLTDADVDGGHISSLLLGLLLKVVPDVIKNGMVYALYKAPLFKTNVGSKNVYGRSLAELMKKTNGKGIVTRIKGWGEIGPDILAEVAFDRTTRHLVRVTMEDAKASKRFVKIMGEDPSTRKEMLGV